MQVQLKISSKNIETIVLVLQQRLLCMMLHNISLKYLSADSYG